VTSRYKITFLKIMISALILLPLNLTAQVLNFRHFGANEGLIQSQVNSILQDDMGRLWFGTYNGISIFDGINFGTITQKDGLGSNTIFNGFKDRSGNLWFGHSNGMLSKYDWQTKKIEKIYLSEEKKDSVSVGIMDIFQDKSGRIWIGTDRWGVFYIEQDSLRQSPELYRLGKGTIYAINQDDTGLVWLGSDSLIYKYDSRKNSFDSLAFQFDHKNVGYQALMNDQQGNMWIGTYYSGAARYNFADKSLDKYTTKTGLGGNQVSSIYMDSKNRIWISDHLTGVAYSITNEKNEIIFKALNTQNGLPFDGVNTTLEDSEGNHWFGTSGRGATQLRDRRFELWIPGSTIEHKSVWSFFIDEKTNTYWFGTGDGICVLDKDGAEKFRITKYNDKRLDDILKIINDKNNKLWFISNQRSLFSINKKTYKTEPFKLPDSLDKFLISSFEIDGEGNYWIGGLGFGLLKYNPTQNSFKHILKTDKDYKTNIVNNIYKDSKSNIWIGLVNDGLYKIVYGELRKINGAPNSILGIAEGPMNDYWILTSTDQLYQYVNNSFINYTVGRGLEGHTLYSVVADSQSVWVGTSIGVARNIYGDSSFTFYGTREGFPISETNEMSVYKEDNGILWFGTIAGAVRYHPDQERLNKIPPQTHITGLKLFHKKIPFPSNGLLSYKQNHLTFNFIGVSLTVPERVKYRYFLRGFDESFFPDTDIPSVTYSNLAPGKYTFQVRACNNDGVWNNLPTEYKFEILAPFWQTRWFLLLSFIVVSALIYLFVQWRMHSVKRMNVILGLRVEEHTSELQKEKESLEQALGALKESETKFRTYTELTSSGIFIYQGNNFQYFNQACVDISGYPEEELINKSIWDLVHPDYHMDMKKRLADRMAGKEVLNHYEFKARRKDGEVRWVDFSGQLIDHNNGHALLATLVDITERKLAEEALLAEKERLAVTLRSIGDGVITTDIDGNISLINERANVIIGSEDQDPLNNKLEKVLFLFDEHSGRKITNPVKEVIENSTAETADINCILKSADGRQKFVSFANSALKDKNNKLIGTVLVLRDITEKKQMEQELFKSQKLESVGVLAGGIAHDFNNILTAIIGNLSLAKLTVKPGDKVYDRISKAEKASARAQELTQQLLTFSKGGAPIKKVNSIEEIVRDSVGFVLSGSNVKCRLDFEKDIPALEVDAGQISQVLQNLVINADQAMPDGGEINIHVKQTELKKRRKGLNPGAYVQLDVSDEGIGIPKDYLDKIFDPFFTTKQAGSGLGLATSYSIIKKHSGLLSVKSEIEKGTVFTIYIPVNRDIEFSELTVDEELSDFHGIGKVLVMDDESFIHETATAMLNKIGYDVSIANDGDEALEQYKKAMNEHQPFSAVIMDLTIPGGMGGKTAINKLLEMDPSAAVIVSSGYSSDPVMSDFSEYGFKSCLKKPYRINELIRSLKDLELPTQNV